MFVRIGQWINKVLQQLMRHQQAINKYVEMIKKYENRKNSIKMASPKQLLNLTNTTQSSFFKKYVQQKIKNKIKEIRFIQTPMQPTLTTLQLNKEEELTIKKGKRKFEVYQQQIEKRITLEKQEEDPCQKMFQRAKSKEYQFGYNKNSQEQASRMIHHKAKTLGFRNMQLHQKSNATSYNFSKESKSVSKSETINFGKKMCELDGTIFHFQKQSEQQKPEFPFYRNMFHHKDYSNEKAAIYSLLKAMPPVIIKPKLIKQGLTQNRSFALRKHSKIQKKINIEQVPFNATRINFKQPLIKSKILTQLQKKERISLKNLKQANQGISGWEISQEK